MDELAPVLGIPGRGYKKDGSPQRRNNQFSTQRALDAEGHRRRIKVGMLLARAERIALGKEDATQSEVGGLKLLLDKALPTLQAVEVTNPEGAILRSESDLLADLKRLVEAHPEIIKLLLAQSETKSAEEQAIEGESESISDVISLPESPQQT